MPVPRPQPLCPSVLLLPPRGPQKAWAMAQPAGPVSLQFALSLLGLLGSSPRSSWPEGPANYTRAHSPPLSQAPCHGVTCVTGTHSSSIPAPLPAPLPSDHPPTWLGHPKRTHSFGKEVAGPRLPAHSVCPAGRSLRQGGGEGHRENGQPTQRPETLGCLL